MEMRSILLLLSCATLGGAFAPNLALSATRSSLWRHAAPCRVSVPKLAPAATRSSLWRHDTTCPASGAWRVSSSLASPASSGSWRGSSILCETSVHAGVEGGGDLTRATPAEQSATAGMEAQVEAKGEIEAVEKKIETVEEDIEAVEKKMEAAEKEMETTAKKIQTVEDALSRAPPAQYIGITDRGALLKEEQQLRKEKEQLRKKKKQLLKKEEQLLLRARKEESASTSGPAFSRASTTVTDFGAALTGAVVTNNTLELANDTFFLGIPSLGSKLFIRPCYKRLSELLLGSASSGTLQNIVVTGTPGIGKSMFGYYLLYLLRCQGKTVVFEHKGVWYRFSDAGVIIESYLAVWKAGYLDDVTSWYLSDPDDRPSEFFSGTTVVLASPKAVRVKDFMNQAKSKKFFMPVWSQDELLDCRRALFSNLRSTDVEKAFGVVGGVARAVFDMEKLGQLKRKMEKNVGGVDVRMLRVAASLTFGPVSIDDVGDALFHIFPAIENNYEDYTVGFASDVAKDLVVEQVVPKEVRALLSFLGIAAAHPELGKLLGGPVVECLFERAAHQAIGLPAYGERRFKMRVLTHSGSKDMLGGRFLSFHFTESKSFGGGNAFPDTFDIGPYFVPASQTFAAIDFFGVDSGSSTLYFFQIKSAGVKAVDGGKVEEYWDIVNSNVASIKNCVFVYVVPGGEAWQKATEIGEGGDWLKGATDGFKSACIVCVIEIPLQN